MSGVSLTNYKVIQPGQIAYVPDTSRRGDKVSLGYNDTTESFLLSSISIVFETNHDFLLPDYLQDQNLIDMHVSIPGDLQEKLLTGMKCATLKFQFPI